MFFLALNFLLSKHSDSMEVVGHQDLIDQLRRVSDTILIWLVALSHSKFSDQNLFLETGNAGKRKV